MGLETVELVVSWEREFGISIPDATAACLVSPEVAGREISRILHAEGKTLPMPEIQRIIKKTTLEITGLREDEYAPELRFAEDFGLD